MTEAGECWNVMYVTRANRYHLSYLVRFSCLCVMWLLWRVTLGWRWLSPTLHHSTINCCTQKNTARREVKACNYQLKSSDIHSLSAQCCICSCTNSNRHWKASPHPPSFFHKHLKYGLLKRKRLPMPLWNMFNLMDSAQRRKAFLLNKLPRLYDTRRPTALWDTTIRYGPMESTYQHDYKRPIMIGPPVKARPPPSTEFWNRSARYGPLETTYQHDYKTFVPIDYKKRTEIATPTAVLPEKTRIAWEASDKFEQLMKDNQADIEESKSRTYQQRVSITPEEFNKKEAATTIWWKRKVFLLKSACFYR